MKLENEFVVAAPVDQVWDLLMDVEGVAACMPGATFDGYESDAYKGRVKVKLGPITVTYNGVARFVERDQAGGRAVVEATGKEARGPGTASATIAALLIDDNGQTLVRLSTELAVVGKPAQFGRDVMVEVSDKLLAQFAGCLAAQLAAAPLPAPAAPAVAPQVPAPAALRPAAIDLIEATGAPLAKRVAAAVGALIAAIVVFRVVRRILR
jgi:uncharacterized protein